MAVPLGVGPGTVCVCVLQPPLSWWAPVGWTEGWWVGPGSLAQVTGQQR